METQMLDGLGKGIWGFLNDASQLLMKEVRLRVFACICVCACACMRDACAVCWSSHVSFVFHATYV
jgi:hypothetical protein